MKPNKKEVETENETLENKGFNAAVSELVPTEPNHPLETVKDEGGEDTGEVTQGTEEEEKDTPSEQMFIGEFSEADVLSRLTKMDGLEAAIMEAVTQKVMGKFGDVGQQLKALQERGGVSFDPNKLVALKELDEGMAIAIGKDLAEAISTQSFDSDAATKSEPADAVPYIGSLRVSDWSLQGALFVTVIRGPRAWCQPGRTPVPRQPLAAVCESAPPRRRG